MISPVPCEIDGMSIGITSRISKSAVRRMPVRFTHHAAANASAMDKNVAVTDALSELSIAGTVCGCESIAETSASRRFVITDISGSSTAKRKNTPRTIVVTVPNMRRRVYLLEFMLSSAVSAYSARENLSLF